MKRWIERWHGSGPDRGWWVWETDHGNPVAYIGEGDHSERLTSILVEKHNEALASTGADTARHGQDGHAGSPAPSEPVAVVGSDFQLLWCRKDWSKGLRVGDKLYTHPAPSAQSSKAALSDGDIERLASDYIAEDWSPDRYYRDMNLIAFARAILARAGITRKPLTEDAIYKLCGVEDRDALMRRTALYCVRAAERFHGITPQAGKESGDAS